MTDAAGRPHANVWIRMALGGVFAAVLAACGNVTGGGANGEVETYMSGNADRGSSSMVSEAAAPRPALAPVAGLAFEGQVTVKASLELLQVGGATIDLTPAGPVTATVDLDGVQEPRISTAVVPAEPYDSVRVVFTEVSADVSAGLEIGGQPFTGLITVDLSAGSLAVVRPLDLMVRDGGLAAFLLDLDADGWIPLADAGTRTVAPADFAAAVSISRR